MAKNTIRIALGQAATSESKAENLSKGLEFIRIAAEKEADLLILPELFMAYVPLTESTESFISVAENVEGPFVKSLASEAAKHNLHVAVGILEKSEMQGRVHNTVALVGQDGSILAKHRKVQLFDSFGFRESDRIVAGKEFEEAFETSLAKMGMITCYELRFPELTRMLAMQGAELILVPSAWVAGRVKEEHLSILARARALENTVFVAVACQTGRIYTGRSTIIDPFAISICDAGEEEGVVVADVDLGRTKRVRDTLPSLRHLRKDIVQSFFNTMKDADASSSI